jgi:uncharacterized protein (DUF1501 family)
MNTTRRQFLLTSAAALVSSPAFSLPAARADALVVLWMNGGPSHIDTFDPKRGKSAGPSRSIATRAAGVEIGEHLPLLAEQAHQLAIVRGMSSKEGSHERARYLAHTGYAPTPTVAHPSLGAWIAAERAGDGELPAFVSLGGPSAGAGILGPAHAPFVVTEPGAAPENTAPGFGVAGSRFDRRLGALSFLEERFARKSGDQAPHARAEVQDRAVRMMKSDALGAFDVASEPDAVRAAYGDTPFGRGCLAARRLLEAGVRVVEVTLDGWDTHQDNFERVKTLCGVLDPAMSQLLADLAARDRLARTLVLCMGEFGRSPGINGNEGRDHHPRAFSAVLAGGGIRGGVVHGATDDQGDAVVSGATSIADLFATVARQLGVDPEKTVTSPAGRPISVSDHGTPIAPLLGT